MKNLKFGAKIFLTIILIMSISFLIFCTKENPVNTIGDIITGEKNDAPLGSLSKLPSQELYISSRAELQLKYTQPDYNWNMIDLTEGRSFVLVYSPKKLINSPAEDLLPRVTIVEMVFDDSEMQDNAKGWRRTTKWGADYRDRILKEKYGKENVDIIIKEESKLKEIPCVHFKYKVKYPVSKKEAVTDEYCFLLHKSYYIVQLSRNIEDVNNENVQEALNRFLNSLQITKSLIS